MRANIMQSPKLHLSKYDKSRSNVVFTSYLPRFCYGGNSVFSSSVVCSDLGNIDASINLCFSINSLHTIFVDI